MLYIIYRLFLETITITKMLKCKSKKKKVYYYFIMWWAMYGTLSQLGTNLLSPPIFSHILSSSLFLFSTFLSFAPILLFAFSRSGTFFLLVSEFFFLFNSLLYLLFFSDFHFFRVFNSLRGSEVVCSRRTDLRQ